MTVLLQVPSIEEVTTKRCCILWQIAEWHVEIATLLKPSLYNNTNNQCLEIND